MPTNTFFHLPEEKRQRLMEAVWQEFTQVPFSSASINRIVKDARIPRGSFYQYFADKEDLIAFFLRGFGDDLWEALERHLPAHGGNLFTALLAVFDDWFLQAHAPNPSASRKLMLLLKNPLLDWRQLVFPDAAPKLPRRIQSLLSPLPAAPDSVCEETVHMLAITLFTDICKFCLFTPEKASVFRQELLQTFQLISPAVSTFSPESSGYEPFCGPGPKHGAVESTSLSLCR